MHKRYEYKDMTLEITQLSWDAIKSPHAKEQAALAKIRRILEELSIDIASERSRRGEKNAG